MKNSLLNRFVPKESKFFPLLNQLSQTVLNASELLIDSMNHDTPETWQEYYHKVKEAEKERRPDNPADFHGARPDLYHPL